MLLTDEEIYATWGEAKNEAYSFREFARAIESAVLEKLQAQEPFAYFSINDYGAWEETSDPTAHALYEHPDPRVAELEAVLRECYYALDAYWDRELRERIKAIAKIDEVLPKPLG